MLKSNLRELQNLLSERKEWEAKIVSPRSAKSNLQKVNGKQKIPKTTKSGLREVNGGRTSSVQELLNHVSEDQRMLKSKLRELQNLPSKKSTGTSM